MNRKLTVLFAVACLLFSFGCAEVSKQMDEFRNGLQPKREITDNIFYLSSPEIKLKISSDLKFMGKIKGDDQREEYVANRLSDPLESSLRSTSYIFGQIDEGNTFQRGIIIRIHTVLGDPNQTTPALFLREDRLESGTIKIIDEEYHYFTLVSPDALLKNEQQFLSGFSIPDCFLVKCLERDGSFGNKSKIQILYIEKISISGLGCSEWSDAGTLSEIQRLSLDDFIERSYASIRFMEEKEIVDRTSKYVDEKESDPSRYTETRDETLQRFGDTGSGDGNIEKKLQELKRLVEKGLITQEDYDKKKKQILENF